MTKKEYGGYLPLELNPGNEFFHPENMMRFNSVKASLFYLLKKLKLETVYIPFYYCPSTSEAIEKMAYRISYYHINHDLLPERLTDEDGCVIVLVNYFGIRTDEITELAQSYEKATVIIDNAHAFFAQPVFKNNVYNVYSAKKFFGVPDGSYLVGKGIQYEDVKPSSSCSYAEFLLTSYELGTNAAYADKKAADAVIAAHYESMSRLAIALLQNVDYDRVKKTRQDNFAYLNRLVGEHNRISVPESCPAYQYPLLLPELGENIKGKLVQNHIYVSTLWKGKNLLEHGNSFELEMSRHGIFLPIDQRYDEKDMAAIAKSVLEEFDQ